MYNVRLLSDLPPRYRAGQCVELHDRDGALVVASGAAEPCTAADVKTYNLTLAVIDRAVERRVSAEAAKPACAVLKTARRRVVTEDQWHRELGRNMPGYWKLADRHFRQQLESRK